ncbi:MAG: hypothetical protein F6K10_34800 [Moorea sp. SIO2B7]|nr:hypothetical protein [Moorena sp. SIO2B7]
MLTSDQRDKLEGISRNGHAASKKILDAQGELMCDQVPQGKRKWTDEQISSPLNLRCKFNGQNWEKILRAGNRTQLESEGEHLPTFSRETEGRTICSTDCFMLFWST